MKLLKIIAHITIIFLLTFLTQIGGVVWLIAIILSFWLKWKKRYIFILIYLASNLVLIPFLAAHFGRVQLPVFNSEIKPQSLFYVLSFRNYVTPKLKSTLEQTALDLKSEKIFITYMDANFPFFDGFPLLPHLSHNDGKKIDIAFQYKSKDGKPTNKKPSFLGYGNYVEKVNTTNIYCISKGYWQYDITKYLNLYTNDNLTLDKIKTKKLIQEIINQSQTKKIFLEPYLKNELGLNNYSKIRFHGCHAVRHDDHVHVETK